MDYSIEALLAQTLGTKLLAYVMAASAEDIDQRLRHEKELTPDQESTLGKLAEVVAAEAAATNGLDDLLYHIYRFLSGYDEDSETSTANVLRLASGGSIIELPSSEDLKRGFIELIRDIYFLFLIPDDHDTPSFPKSMLLGTSAHFHPRHKWLENEIRQHDVLRVLLSGSDQITSDCMIYTSAAQAGSPMSPTILIHELVGAGWEWARLSNLVPSPEEHIAGFEQALDTLLAAVRYENVSVPVRIGLTGVLLPENSLDVDLGWARIRAVKDFDSEIIFEQELSGSVHGSDGSGESVTVRYSGDVVVEMRIPYKVRLMRVQPDYSWPEDLNLSSTILKRIQNIQIGLLLTAPDAIPRPVCHQAWTKIINPLRAMPSMTWTNVDSMRGISPQRLSHEQVLQWKEWSILVSENRMQEVDISISRILRAASNRSSPEDVLVDAVVVWENLFGAKNETTMRVCNAMAWLLGHGVNDRKERVIQYKKLYSLRSNIVHGTRSLTSEEIKSEPERAFKIALDALCVIFRDRRDLLQLKGSENRSNELILGG